MGETVTHVLHIHVDGGDDGVVQQRGAFLEHVDDCYVRFGIGAVDICFQRAGRAVMSGSGRGGQDQYVHSLTCTVLRAIARGSCYYTSFFGFIQYAIERLYPKFIINRLKR